MKFKILILFFFCSFSVFSQTQKLLDAVKLTNSDSISQLTPLKNLLIKSVKLEYSGYEALDKYTDIAVIFYSKGNQEFSQDFFELALLEAEKLGDIEKEAELLSNIGVFNEIKGDYVTALTNYQESLKIFNEAGNERSTSIVYNNIAIVHQELGNIDLAYQNLLKSYEIKLELQDSILIASTLNNFGVFYEECNVNLDSAIIYYQAAKNMYSDFGDSLNEAICTSNIAQVLLLKGEYDEAREYLLTAVGVFRFLQNDMWLSKALMYLGELDLNLKNSAEAVELLEESKSIISVSDNPIILLQISEILAESYIQNGQFEESAYEFKKCEFLRDSLLNIDKQNEISKLEIKFQTAEKQYEIDSLKIEKDIQQQRTKLIVWFVTALVILLISVIVFLYMRGKHRKLEKQNKSMQIKQQLLQNQMNPHFLFNVLTSIQSYITSSETEKAADYLAKFSKLTRMVLQSSAHEKVLLEDELSLLSNYLQLEKLRHSDKFNFELIVDDGIDVEEIEIPPMMIQPFVENAIIHGASKVENGKIQLLVKQDGDFIEFRILDNGPGFTKNEDKISSHKSMAMSILQERKEILKQKWHKNVEIKRKDLEKGTEIAIVLPII